MTLRLGILCFILSGSLPALSITRGPYLQSASDSSIVVRWRTDSASDSTLLYGLSVGALSVTVSAAPLVTEHVLTITALSPDTAYIYAIGSSAGILAGDDASHSFRTFPVPGSSGTRSVWVIGDAGSGYADQASVFNAYQAAYPSPPAAWLQLGDNAYDSGTDAEYGAKNFNVYQALYQRSACFPVLGNHDSVSLAYPDLFSLPASDWHYYSFDLGQAHFLMLDADSSDRSVTGPMHAWAQADLTTTSATWIIACWHQPPYAKGSHDSDTELSLLQMRQNFLPLLEAHGVDLVLGGHNHCYARTALIDGHYGDAASFDPTLKSLGGHIVMAGDGYSTGPYLKAPGAHQGTVYAIVGSSGGREGGPLPHPAQSVFSLEPASMQLQISDTQLDATVIGKNGAILDRFGIKKGTPPVFRRPDSIQLGPSPARINSIQRVMLPSAPKKCHLRVLSLDGSLVRHVYSENEPYPYWSTYGLAPGLYFVRIEAELMNGTKLEQTRKTALIP